MKEELTYYIVIRSLCEQTGRPDKEKLTAIHKIVNDRIRSIVN
ncbi:hypothetical protein ES705_33877 [subsurface metagenome]